MFTGLIQCIGKVKAFTQRGAEASLTIDSDFQTFTYGESIAINGACLSVTEFSGSTFSVFASRETLQISGIGNLLAGTAVNLEKALTLSTPLGGHLVAGHVDAWVRVLGRIRENAASRFQFALPDSEELKYQIAPKGSVTIDGVSLTVNAVTDTMFEVMIIPVTLQHTTLGNLNTGDMVNIETDILAKYITRRFDNPQYKAENNGVSMALLMQNGFMR
ncbi:MAG: riboflavin synthase [Deltaproteobacteria bacterium]|nr:riboflavin synthase [Deltaproteobacteria bacterium]